MSQIFLSNAVIIGHGCFSSHASPRTITLVANKHTLFYACQGIIKPSISSVHDDATDGRATNHLHITVLRSDRSTRSPP